MQKGAEGLFAGFEGQKEGDLQDSDNFLLSIRFLRQLESFLEFPLKTMEEGI